MATLKYTHAELSGMRAPLTRACLIVFIAAVAFDAVGPPPTEAHGFGQRYDLPVPLLLWLGGAALAVAFSFIVVAVFVRGATARATYPRLDLLKSPLGRALAHPVVTVTLKAAAVAALVFVVVAGLLGSQNPTRNPAPVLVWVVWWVGFAYVSALLGNVWALVNPWKTVFGWAEALQGPLARNVPYPKRWDVWPAVVLYLAFAWIELVFPARAEPASLSVLVARYSVITWIGMLMFGPAVWLRHGDPFTLFFGLISRFSPTEVRVIDPSVCRECPLTCDGRPGDCVDCHTCFARASEAVREWNLRPFAVGLLEREGMSTARVVFIVVVLASVTFDGFTATPAWAAVESALYAAWPTLGGARFIIIGTLGLLLFPGVFLAVYVAFARWMADAGGAGSVRTVAQAFVSSLVPIAIGYHLAHYFSYLLIQGQLLVPMLSDPLTRGWDLFGGASYRPDIGIVGARFAWYTAVTSIVGGHVIAVAIAHATALREFASPRLALRSQYPMLALMVGYTVLSLWIVAQPIVETGGAG